MFKTRTQGARFCIVRTKAADGRTTIEFALVERRVSRCDPDSECWTYRVRFVRDGRVERDAYDRPLYSADIGTAYALFIALENFGGPDVASEYHTAWKNAREIAEAIHLRGVRYV